MRTRLVPTSTVTCAMPGSPERSPSMFAWHLAQEMSGAVSSISARFMCLLLCWRARARLRARAGVGQAGGAETAQPQRVADDGDRAGGHGERGEHGGQDPGGGQGDEEQVVAERPGQVLADDAAG